MKYVLSIVLLFCAACTSVPTTSAPTTNKGSALVGANNPLAKARKPASFDYGACVQTCDDTLQSSGICPTDEQYASGTLRPEDIPYGCAMPAP